MSDARKPIDSDYRAPIKVRCPVCGWTSWAALCQSLSTRMEHIPVCNACAWKGRYYEVDPIPEGEPDTIPAPESRGTPGG